MDSKPILKIDEDGTKYWRLDGNLHREDGPAIIVGKIVRQGHKWKIVWY